MDDAIIVLAGSTSNRVTLIGTKSEDSTIVVVKRIHIQRGEKVSAELFLAHEQLVVPMIALEPSGDEYVFTKDPANAALNAARERLRKLLSTPVELKAGAGFFGATEFLNTSFKASVTLTIPALAANDLGTSDAVLIATASAEAISMNVNGKPFYTSVVIEVIIKGDLSALASFRLENPTLSGFKLHLPEVPFDKFTWKDLKFDFLANAFPSLDQLSLPFVDKLEFKWTDRPELKLNLNGTTLSIATTIGKGTLSLKGTVDPILQLKEFQISSISGSLSVVATVTIYPTPKPVRIIDNLSLKDEKLPFDVRISGVDMTVAPIVVGAAAFKFIYTVQRIEVRAKQDPGLVLAFFAQFTVKVNAQAKVDTSLERLDLLDPHPLVLVHNAIEAAGKLIRLLAPIDLPGNTDVLDRIAQMLAAAAQWLAEKADQAVGVLAGVAESIARVLANVFRALRDSKLFSGVVIEVRLTPEAYRLAQIIVTPRGKLAEREIDLSRPGFDFFAHTSLNPALVFNFGRLPWFGVALQDSAVQPTKLSLGTDLWLDKAESPAQPLKDADPKTGDKNPTRLITVTAELKKQIALVPIAIQSGRVLLFQKTTTGPKGPPADFPISVGETGELAPVNLSEEVKVEFKADALQKRVLALLPKPNDGGVGPDFLKSLDQYVEIKEAKGNLDAASRSITVDITIVVVISPDSKPEATLQLSVSLDDFSAHLKGDRIRIPGHGQKKLNLLGLGLTLEPKSTANKEDYEEFFLDLSQGREAFGLGKDVDATLAFGKLGGEGRGLVFKIDEFLLGRNGLDLSATAIDEPVTLGGINMPFRFKSGSIAIKNSKLRGGTLTGTGQLPPALIGEANVTISLALGTDAAGAIRVVSADCKLDKSNDPIVCESTRFKFSLSKVELSFVEERGYHFYFLLTGSARFSPGPGEFTDGLLKHLGDIEIVLDRAPLAADSKVLARAINFQIKVNPPKKTSFFDLFEFELRGVGFHPAADAFGGSPALSISGQVNFAQFGDIVSPNFDFHRMWIAPPAPGRSLPRVRFDGLGVGLKLGGMAEVYGTAIAVDEKLPDLFRPDVLPANVTANGFLASGRLAISGWASMSAAMGFLELRERNGDNLSAPKFAFFFYGQANLLAEKIPTPVGPIYLREVGFGFGWRYTLAGIAAVETVDKPEQLIKVLDDISKFQGSLDKIESWSPTFNSPTLTLAMRALFTIASVSTSSHYDEKGEKDLPNPLLFDVVAAIRSDLTFLINARAWLSVNYADWHDEAKFGSARERPGMRGYIYLSVPKQMFLGRFIGDRTGHIGNHPPVAPNLKLALERSDYSATLFIRPGLFHFELGWPFELKVSFGNPSDNFFIECSGGMVLRIEDGAMLHGFAFRGRGFAKLGGNRGGSFGASAQARADFAIEGKLLAYLSLRRKEDSMFYGSFRLDVHIKVSVRVWFEFKVFGGHVRWETGFELGLTVAVAIEVALLGDGGLGGRIHASVGIQAFGRSMTLGIELKFNDGVLETARSRVARFLSIGLAAQVADESAFNRPPVVESSREARAIASDEQIVQDAQTLPAEPSFPDGTPLPKKPFGVEIAASDFWAMLYPTKCDEPGEFYLMQLVPKDLTDVTKEDSGLSTFYAPPLNSTNYVLSVPDRAKLKHLNSDGKLEDVKPDVQMNLTRPAFEFQNEEFKLKDVLETLFMGAKKGNEETEPYSDPQARVWKREKTFIAGDAEAAARELQKASRQRRSLHGVDRDYAEIEERRSAMIGVIGDSAAAIAAAGQQADGRWKPPTEVNALDFGLTYLIERKNLVGLFEKNEVGPRKSFIEIQKVFRLEDGEAALTKKGKVFLFNPPERMFREASPKLADPKPEVTPACVEFRWDLEPAWTTSQSLYDDPEFHLHHYEIVRTIRGFGNSKTLEMHFSVKPGAPVQKGEDGGYEILNSGVQFVDDLTNPVGFPRELRRALLDQTRSLTDWENAGLGEKVTLSYVVRAVDIAGTNEQGTPLEIDIWPPAAKFPPLKEVGVVVTGKVKAPTSESGVQLASRLIIRLRIHLANVPFSDGEYAPLRFNIKVSAADTLPVGQYGGDSLTVAMEDTDQSVIAHVSPASTFVLDVTDLKVGPGVPDLGTDEVAVLVEWTDESGRALSGMAKGSFSQPHLGSSMDDDDSAFKRFAEASGFLIGASFKPQAHRFFLQQISLLGDSTKSSDWFKATVEMIYGFENQPPAIQAVFEEFEAPLQLEFKSIKRSDFTRVEAGRLHFLIPGENSNFDKLLLEPSSDSTPAADPEKTPNIRLIRDPDRRSAINMRWLARPNSLELVDNHPVNVRNESWRLIGGFNVKEIVTEPRDLFTVSLLPTSSKGKEPSELGDLARIQAHYPSDALREVASGKLRKSPWFSRAESLPVWPDRVVRRSLIPAPDESVISALFEKGRPRKLRARLLSPFLEAYIGTLDLSSDVSPTYKPSDAETTDWSRSFVKPGEQQVVPESETLFNPLDPRDVRAILQQILLKPLQFDDAGYRLDREYAKQADALAGALIELIAMDDKNNVLVTQKVAFDAAPSLHPVIADSLDFLHYAPYQAGEADDGFGNVYRRYEIVADPGPETPGITLEEWIDSSPPDRDPYGWGILRTLGLASGFRIFDTETGEFRGGRFLLNHIKSAFERALARYSDLNVGSPFVDLIAEPWGTARVFSYDGGFPDHAEDETRLLKDDLLSIVQVSLRPRVDQIGFAGRPEPKPNPQFDSDWIIQHKMSPLPARYKLLPSAVRYWKIALPQGTGEVTISVPESTTRFDLHIVEQSQGVAVELRGLISSTAPDLPKQYKLSGRRSGPSSVFIRTIWHGDATRYPNFKIEGKDGDGQDLKATQLDDLLSLLQEKHVDARVLSSFEPLSAVDWVGIRDTKAASNSATQALLTLENWAKRRFPATVLPTEIEKRQTYLNKLAVWAERFLRYGGATRTEISDQKIKFSLATMIRPAEWRMPVASDGTVGVFLADESGYGFQRRFVVQPFGRYQSFIKALENPDNKPRTAANPNLSADNFADVTVPRTAPVAKPVILSAKRLSGAAKAEVLELVVSRTGDEILAEANQTTEAGLAANGISVGFFREFPYQDWATHLLPAGHYNPNVEFGSLDTRVEPGQLTLVDDSTPADPRDELPLYRMPDQVPDAWLGAWIFRMASLPYFFRVHALVHANAGVVISEQSGATFEEGIVRTRWPHKGLLDPTSEPFYSVTRFKANGKVGVHINFNLPLIAFADCMTDPLMWFKSASRGARELAFLPDPGIAYRILTEAVVGSPDSKNAEPISRDPDFDFVPSPNKENRDETYLVQTTGSRFVMSQPAPEKGLLRIKASPIPNTERWQIQPEVELASKADLPVEAFNPFPLPGPLKGLVVKPQNFKLWRPFAPTGKATLHLRRQPADDIEWQALAFSLDAHHDMFREYGSDLELVKIIADLKSVVALPLLERGPAWLARFGSANPVRELNDWVIGLPSIHDSLGIIRNPEPFHWPVLATTEECSRSRRRGLEIALKDLALSAFPGHDGEPINPELLAQILGEISILRTAVRNRFIALNIQEHMQTKLAPVFRDATGVRDFEKVEFNRLAEQHLPFDSIERFEYRPPFDQPEADWKAAFDDLFDYVERSPFSADAIATLGVIEDHIASLGKWPLALSVPGQVLSRAKELLIKLFPNLNFVARSAVLRYPPNDEDLQKLVGIVPQTHIQNLYKEMASEQLFGPGRRPVVSAIRGADAAMVFPIARKGINP